jgi:hypothetical protein
VSAILIAAAFGFALPHVASYRSVWVSVEAMTWPYALLVATAATDATVASHLTLWLVLLACLRATGLSQAQVPRQTSQLSLAPHQPKRLTGAA